MKMNGTKRQGIEKGRRRKCMRRRGTEDDSQRKGVSRT
jgi:hypothetical protein